jgi:5-dehydro-2-deoxygluconokinase
VDLGFNRRRRLAAVVVGRAGMDLYPLPDGTDIEGATQLAPEVGGSAGNIAVAIARHGLPVALVGAVSDDAVGRFVRAHLERLGVDTGHFRSVRGAWRTSLAICETRPEDSETVFYRNGAADLELSVADVDAALIAGATFLVVTGTAFAANPSRAAARLALALARKSGTFSILDVDHRPVSWRSDEEAGRVLGEAATECDAIVANEEEFAVLGAGPGKALEWAAAFARGGRRLAIVKHGRAGSVAVTAAASIDTPSVAVESVKPFGAGDAFLGNLVVALHRGLELEPALARATAAAAYVVARRGCAFAMPDAGELDRFMADYPARRGS